MICEQVDALGILSSEWWAKWDARQRVFHENGEPKYRKPFRSWEDRFEDSVQEPQTQEAGMAVFDVEEKLAIFELLQAMLRFRPEERITARQVLEFEWMAKWALPEYEKIRY